MILTIPKTLREKLGENGTNELVEVLNQMENNSVNKTIEVVENRFERRLAEECGKLRAEIIKWMFVFWIGQSATTIATMFAIVKYIK